LSFELRHALRRHKPQRRAARLKRRPFESLRFVPDEPSTGPELLLDTCVYIDVLQRRASEPVKRVLATRLCNHSGIALAELTHLLGRLNPSDSRTTDVLTKIATIISGIPAHRLRAPSLSVLGEAGILAGMTARLLDTATGRKQALLNDAILYMQAIENGQTVLTRNIREFDCFEQLFPSNRVLFYARGQEPGSVPEADG
jgi:predicted nucleic acid-binding protein